ncbi:MAG: class I SAM-dependent methyltransferase [Chloroflexi bacterium]|nr:class I SAM-dependent methyltransferase [Chloroflexota bacterium]
MMNYENPFWGEIYDLIHGGDDADVDFYLDEAMRANGPVLEVACGTGRILLRLLQLEIDAWGIDVSQPMLDRLAEKARRLGLQARAVRADMRAFTLSQRFALIIVPFRSFLHLETKEDQLAALSCFRKHLAPDGRLALNFFAPVAEALAGGGGGLRLGREIVDAGTGRRYKAWQSVSNDHQNRRQTIDWVLQELSGGGEVVATNSLPLRLHWIYKSEFELLLKAAGFSQWSVYGGFNGEPLEGEGQEMVWIASV